MRRGSAVTSNNTHRLNMNISRYTAQNRKSVPKSICISKRTVSKTIQFFLFFLVLPWNYILLATITHGHHINQQQQSQLQQGTDKTWNENEPVRIPYTSSFVDASHKEEKTQVVFITLTTIFVAIVICCLIEVYRTNRAHKKRIERETDESIIWSKEQATKTHNEAAAAAAAAAAGGSNSTNPKSYSYKPVS